MSYDKDRIKESLTEEDIIKILADLGDGDCKKDNQGNLMFKTKCHNITGGSHKLYYYKESCSFYCYSQCNESYDIYGLVMKAKRLRGNILSFPQALSYVANLTGKHYRESFSIYRDSPYMIDDWDFINNYKTRDKPKIDLPIYDDTVLEVFRYLPHRDWLEEGMSWETMKKFNISYYIKDDKIVIPHYDMDGNLVGIRGRAMRQEDLDRGGKYMPLIVGGEMYNHPLAFNLYGLNINKENIKRRGEVTIYEGEKSVIISEEYYPNESVAVAVGGSNISDIQRNILLDLGVRKVNIAFDKQYEDVNSEEAQLYARQIRKLADKFLNYCNVYIVWDTEGILGYKDSPIDCGKDSFEELLRNRIEIKREENVVQHEY